MRKIEVLIRCVNGHEQKMTLLGHTREQAEFWCGLMDGTSPAYLHKPRDDDRSSIGRCVTCREFFDAKIVKVVDDAEEDGQDPQDGH